MLNLEKDKITKNYKTNKQFSKKNKKFDIEYSFYLKSHRLLSLLCKKGDKGYIIRKKLILSLLKLKRKNNNLKENILISELINGAIENVKPVFALQQLERSKGKNKKIIYPRFIVSQEIREFIAVKLIIKYSKKRKKGCLYENLASEIIDAYEEKGEAVRYQEELALEVLKDRSSIKYRW